MLIQTEIEESLLYRVINCKALKVVSKSTYAFHPDCGQIVNVIVLRVECGVGGPGFGYDGLSSIGSYLSGSSVFF